MSKRRPVIITCAVTGAIHTPSMSSHLPASSSAIVASAVAAAEAGAAILHLHARNDQTGQPDQSVEGFGRIVPQIAAQTNAVLNLTTGGSPYMTVQERVSPAATFAPQLASLNMWSMNMALFPMQRRYPDLPDWEQAHLEGSKDLVFRNSYKDIDYVLDTCRDNGTRFEFECYDTAHPDDIAHMRRTALRLFGDDMIWSALGAGAQQMRAAAMCAWALRIRFGPSPAPCRLPTRHR